MFACCISELAFAEELTPIKLHHASWTARDGAPSSVLSMTQTADGWLWLGGPAGLVRFDGIRFEQFVPSNAPLATKNISVVNAFADGSLWLGYRTGGAAHVQQGRIRNYGEKEGLPNRAVWGVERDGDGRIWAATAQGMYYLDQDRWRAPSSEWKIPGVGFKTLMRDRAGVLWAQCDHGIYSLRPGAGQFVQAPVNSGPGVLFNLNDGSVVSWDPVAARFNRLAGPGQATIPPQWQRLGDPGSLLFDHHGDLWVGLNDGLEFRTGGRKYRTTPAQGLSGRAVGALFEDREGNIWAATANGIDRFRGERLEKLDVPEPALGAAIVADDNGGAWVGGFHISVSEGGDSSATPLWLPSGVGWADMLTSFTRSSDGVLWGSSFGALRRVQGRDSRRLELPSAIGNLMITSLLAEADGSLLVAVQQHGLYRRKPNGDWEKAGPEGEVSVMARSDTSGVWLAYRPGSVVHAAGPAWRSYGPADGLAIGLVMALHPKERHLWAGGDNGLALFDAGRFRRVKGTNGETFDGISGIVEMENGDLWLNASSGLFRIASGEIQRFRQDAEHQVHYERLDQLDGLDGLAPRVYPSPSLVRSSDGRLWIVRSSGVFRLDPRQQLPHAPSQAAIIKTIGPAGEDAVLKEKAQFGPGVPALQIDYTVPALAMPERVHFRYQLDGVDTEWQEVGARRSAYYSNLPAGDYRFRVAASDYNGDWTQEASSAHFTIVPAVTETWWFKAACSLLLISAAYLAYRWHIVRVARNMAHRLQERVSERERIARELHDTLLQSVQSLILHIHAAVVRLPQQDTVRMQLENALRQADDVMDEGRGRIRDLRGDDGGKLSFPDAVLAAASRLQPRDGATVQLKLSGTERQLHRVVYHEALGILAEAITNAYGHAKAQRIEVALQYGARDFRCTVRDDGVGIPDEVLKEGGRDGHWGLRGMAERAARMGGKLVLHSSGGSGTEWQLTLPAALAYTR